ncbi:hypothetical protein AVEN_98411-1 [Araneus ventricosus]|uniref:Uncharacterized protein n=1 Tax=Araneus ventricosus TaxID=182803 RepID=A0A4Y2JXB3_ARAVE|nr:hypothetical protein AVEN_98411-1 [Araneus ventricosus]
MKGKNSRMSYKKSGKTRRMRSKMTKKEALNRFGQRTDPNSGKAIVHLLEDDLGRVGPTDGEFIRAIDTFCSLRLFTRKVLSRCPNWKLKKKTLHFHIGINEKSHGLHY